MKEFTSLFWNARVEELKKGYIYEPEPGEFTCLVCGARFVKGQIYTCDNILFEAELAAKTHIKHEHSSVFEFLLDMNKKYTGLTDHQKEMLTFFYKGYSDKEISASMAEVTASTIRNYRFTLREKAKQAKIFLAIMELLEEKDMNAENFIEIHRTAQMIDERYAVTEAETNEILKNYFKEGADGPLDIFPKREKRKLVVLKNLIRRFEAGKKYNEKEVNEILKQAYHDYVTLRRYMIEYGFMDRTPDGGSYWVKV